jgi:uncharacterized damage-inducible protein DinB
MKRAVTLLLLCAALTFAAKPPKATFAQVFDGDLTSAEKEIVSLAEAMPADKYNFAPSSGEFTGVRTFGLQMRHIAAVNDEVAAAILGEKNPAEMGKSENGPDSLDNKDAIVQFLKDSFTYAHKAIRSITEKNVLGDVKSPFGEGKPTTRASLATILTWHSFDHYGQAVVYARMNGVVPPASRR